MKILKVRKADDKGDSVYDDLMDADSLLGDVYKKLKKAASVAKYLENGQRFDVSKGALQQVFEDLDDCRKVAVQIQSFFKGVK